ncbi:RNA polymerase sigma-70 factor (ECF subfamily) [Pseudonocardia hierapolitana]|uniref:RNA polymerase sigma factor n=1 Tax=Pseudonocardia hierapolitana TaxID=1128676 RepID=A0A561SVN9_9PSEU|nr:RNA polymerase sigma factor [Pseudonocardia hierapolitana]TWF78930.1 RNA polymerase sigma-70 factor (ECF subfamily) [Pseudonocardia hierapolitana]
MHRDDADQVNAGRATERASAGQFDDDADRWLIDKARTGDLDAYEVLVRRHRDRIYRIALRMLGNRHDAEDIAQDVMIQVWTALAGFTGASSFTTWLYRIVVNRCLNQIRRRRWTRPVLEGDPQPVAGAEDTVIARQRAGAAMEAIAALPPDQRAVIVLHQLEGLTYREVAAVVNISEDAVRGRLHRARLSVLASLRNWS